MGRRDIQAFWTTGASRSPRDLEGAVGCTIAVTGYPTGAAHSGHRRQYRRVGALGSLFWVSTPYPSPCALPYPSH